MENLGKKTNRVEEKFNNPWILDLGDQGLEEPLFKDKKNRNQKQKTRIREHD